MTAQDAHAAEGAQEGTVAGPTPPPSDIWTPPAGGYGRPGQPSPYGQPYAQPAPPAPPSPYDAAWGAVPPPQFPQGPRRANGFAIAALVTGLTFCLWPLALAFGITGLVQIPKRGQRGQGMAVTGIVLAGCGMLVTATALGPTHNGRSGSTGRSATGVQAAADLRTGQCFDRSGARVRPVPCTGPHDGEVVGSTRLSGTAYPDQAERERQLGPACADLSLAYAMDDWAMNDAVTERYYYPLEDSWRSGQRTATCFLSSTGGQRTGSLRKDESNSTPAQLGYLRAMDQIDLAAGKRPTGAVADDPAGFREWAGTLAGVLEAQTAALDGATWDPAVKQAVAAHVAELRLRIPALRAAAAPATATELAQHLADSDKHRGYAQQKAVRQLLGLSVDDSWLHQSSGSDGAPRSV